MTTASAPDLHLLYRPEHVVELAAGDRVWVVDPAALSRLATRAGLVLSDRDLAVITLHACRGKIPSPTRLPRRHRKTARVVEAACSQIRLDPEAHDAIVDAATYVETITSQPVWTSRLLDGRRAAVGNTLAGVIATAVEASATRDRVGPPSTNPHVAATVAAVRRELDAQLATARARAAALRRYAHGLHDLAAAMHTAKEVDRINRELDRARLSTVGHTSADRTSVPSIRLALSRLDQLLEPADPAEGDRDVLAAQSGQRVVAAM